MERNRTILGLTVRQHIGGRWAISWVLFAINIPFNLLSITTNISQTPQGDQWLGWSFVALAGLATIGLVFLIGDFVVFRNRRTNPYPVWAVVVFGAVIGVVRGVVVVMTADALGLQQMTAGVLVNRTVAGGLLGAIALPLGAFVLSVIDRYRDERRRLLEELAANERRQLADEEEVRVLRAAVVQGVREEVLEVAREALDNGGGPREVSAALRTASHVMWSADDNVNERRNPPTRVLLATWNRVTSHPLPTAWICLLWGVSAAASLIAVQGLVLGGAQLAFSVGALAICLTFANWWIRANSARWLLAAIASVFLGWIFTSPVGYVLFDPQPLATALPVMILNFFWLPVVVVMTSVAGSAVSSTEAVLDSLRASVAQSEIRTRALEVELDAVVRELAEQLHGSVHSPLVSRAALESDRDQLVEQLGQAVAALQYGGDEDLLVDRLRSVAESWSGLVEVTVTVSGRVERERDVERVVKEAIANAYRHGGASEIAVSVTGSHELVEIVVTDNGTKGVARESGGLGSRLFDTLGSWSLARLNGQTVLTMKLSLS